MMHNPQKVVEDLLQNEDFVAYVRNEPHANHAFWDQWIADHPELHDYVEESILILEELARSHSPQELPTERVDELWDDLADKL